MRAIAIDRTIQIGAFAVRAETLTIDDDDLEFVWSVTPPPIRAEAVLDPDTGHTRMEQFHTPLSLWWSITDGSGRRYSEGGGLSGGDEKRWRTHARYLPAPPPGTEELILTLSEIVPREGVEGRVLEKIQVPLSG